MTTPAPAPEEETRKHNAAARADMIRTVIREELEDELERDAISERIRKRRQTVIKGALGMKIADFAAAKRLYTLEDNDRDQYFDTLRETFEALQKGGQLDFLDGMRSARPRTEAVAGAASADFSEDAAPDVSKPSIDAAYEAGRQASLANKGLAAMPRNYDHPRARRLKAAFQKGYDSHQAELAEKLRPPPVPPIPDGAPPAPPA